MILPDGSNNALQTLLRQRVDTHAFRLRRNSQLLMQLWRDSQIELAGVVPVRIDALFFADLKKHL
jgi:hypothetical protein